MPNKMTVTKIVKFEMAHKLDSCYSEACKNVHGHSYILEITLSGSLNSDGMIMDFKKIKELVQDIVDQYDHKYLCSEECGYNPTAENMAMKIFKHLRSKTTMIEKIRLRETDTCYVDVFY